MAGGLAESSGEMPAPESTFMESVLAAPARVALLARLGAEQRDDVHASLHLARGGALNASPHGPSTQSADLKGFLSVWLPLEMASDGGAVDDRCHS